MTLRQRAPRMRDDKHLAYVRAQPCCVCGSTRDVEAAHLKLRLPETGKEMPGMAEKADDCFVTPLCHYHHQSGILAQHRVGEQRFWFEIHGRNPFEIAASLWIESGGAARALEPKPAKRPRKISRKRRYEAMLEQGMHSGNTDAKFDPPPKPKRRIQGRAAFPAGRKLQSRNNFERREVRT